MVSTGTATREMHNRSENNKQELDASATAPNSDRVCKHYSAFPVCLIRRGNTSVKPTNRLHQKIKKSRPTSGPGYSKGNKEFFEAAPLAGLSQDFYNISEHGLSLLKFHRFLHLLINIYCKESSSAVREVVSISSSRNPAETASPLVSRTNSGERPKAIAVAQLFYELSEGNAWPECSFHSPPKIN